MKRFAAIVLLTGCGGSDLPSVGASVQGAMSGQPVVLHSNWNGASAQTQFGGFMTGASGGYVDVSQNSSSGGGLDAGPGAPNTLSYGWFANDPTSQVCFSMPPFNYCFYTRFSYENGFGSIPASDVNISRNTASLDTTVAPGPNFSIYHCDVDYNTGTFNCSNNTGGGAISVRWVRTNAYSTFNNGVSRTDYGPMSTKTHGQWSSSSASASGTVMALTFSDAPGSLGDTHGSTVVKELSGPNPFPDGGTM